MFKSLFSLLCTILLVTACSNTADQTAATEAAKKTINTGPTVLSGTIKNARATFVQLRTIGQSFGGRLDENGHFEIPFRPQEASFYDLMIDRKLIKLFLKPGDNAVINFDGINPQPLVTFDGDGKLENQYLQAKQQQIPNLLQANQRNYSLPEAEFMKITDENLQKTTAHLEQYAKSNPGMDAEFLAVEKAEATYLWADQFFSYPKYHPHYAQNPSYQPSAAFNAYKEKVDLNNNMAIASPNYQKYLVHNLYEEASALLKADPSLESQENAMTLTNLKVVKEKFTGQRVKNFLTFTVFQDHLKYQSVNNLKALMEEFNKSNTNAMYKQIVNAEYNKWVHLDKGMPAPNFVYNDINGKEVALSDLKGKYVYVDIWATWCGPCKKEIPHLEALQEEYKNNSKIAFVSVSIDKNVDAWEKMVKNKNMQGIQLIADKAGNSQISKDYQVSGIPRFILVDDEGKILDVKAPRPSSPQIKNILAGFAKS